MATHRPAIRVNGMSVGATVFTPRTQPKRRGLWAAGFLLLLGAALVVGAKHAHSAQVDSLESRHAR